MFFRLKKIKWEVAEKYSFRNHEKYACESFTHDRSPSRDVTSLEVLSDFYPLPLVGHQTPPANIVPFTCSCRNFGWDTTNSQLLHDAMCRRKECCLQHNITSRVTNAFGRYCPKKPRRAFQLFDRVLSLVGSWWRCLRIFHEQYQLLLPTQASRICPWNEWRNRELRCFNFTALSSNFHERWLWCFFCFNRRRSMAL